MPAPNHVLVNPGRGHFKAQEEIEAGRAETPGDQGLGQAAKAAGREDQAEVLIKIVHLSKSRSAA